MPQYYYPDTDVTRRNLDNAVVNGGEFDFTNNGTDTPDAVSTIAAGGTWTVDIREQRKYKNAIDYAPFDTLAISNDSNQNIRVYLNTSAARDAAKKIFVASKTDRTYDLAKIVSCTIKNLSTTTSINSDEINLIFIKSSMNTDRLAEQFARKLAPLMGRSKALYEEKRF